MNTARIHFVRKSTRHSDIALYKKPLFISFLLIFVMHSFSFFDKKNGCTLPI